MISFFFYFNFQLSHTLGDSIMTALFPPTFLYSQVTLANLTGTYRLSHQLLYLCGVLTTTPQMNGNTAFYESSKLPTDISFYLRKSDHLLILF